MLTGLFWFVLGGWIGSLVTLVMVALLRKGREVPKPDMRDEEQSALPQSTEKQSPRQIVRSNRG
jgi:hypothetical protein